MEIGDYFCREGKSRTDKGTKQAGAGRWWPRREIGDNGSGFGVASWGDEGRAGTERGVFREEKKNLCEMGN